MIRIGLFNNPLKLVIGGSRGAPPARAPSPQQDQFLSFSHTFSPKSVCIGGWCPLPTGWRPPPTGNPGSATASIQLLLRYVYHLVMIKWLHTKYDCGMWQHGNWVTITSVQTVIKVSCLGKLMLIIIKRTYRNKHRFFRDSALWSLFAQM